MAFSFLSWFLYLCGAALAVKNPILPGFNPDPSVLRVGDEYYIATSTFTVFPGIPIYKSKDLASWELVSHALGDPAKVQLYGISTGNGVWAPSLSYIDGLFYVTSMTMLGSDPSIRTWPRVWWVSSPDLVQWSDVVWGEPFGIDPHLFRDPVSDRTYLSLMSPNNNYERLWGIGQCEVDLQSGKCVGAFRSLWNGTLPQTSSTRPEGPKMFYKDEYYYLVLAEGGTSTGHRVTIGRSRSPEGPWDPAPNNPLIYNGANPNLTIQSTGHATFVDTPEGDWYATILARRNVGNSWSPLGRETFLVSITWEDGWPILNDGKPLLLSQGIGSTPDREQPPPPFVDDFEGPDLGLGWYQLRTPYTTNYKIASSFSSSPNASNGNSGVILLPNVYNLGDRDTPAALIRKQASLNMTFSATLLPTDAGLGPRQSIGISAYINDHTHQDIGVRGCSTAAAVGLCLYMDFERNSPRPQDPPETTEWPLNATAVPGELTLHIRAEPLTYQLGYSLGGGDDGGLEPLPTWTAEFSSQWLTRAPSGFSVFEGAMFAVFASGNGEPWPFDAPEVGFSRVREVYHDENIPDYIT